MKTESQILKNELLISGSTDNLKDARKFIESSGKKCNLNQKDIYQIALAVDEACTNIIEHAYHNSSDNKIKIKVKVSKNQFKVIITDNGDHFDPSQIPEPNIEESQKMKKGGGLGIFLMKKIMDEVKYSTKGKGNELILIKYLK